MTAATIYTIKKNVLNDLDYHCNDAHDNADKIQQSQMVPFMKHRLYIGTYVRFLGQMHI